MMNYLIQFNKTSQKSQNVPTLKIEADVILHQESGYLKFDPASEKAIRTNPVRLEIVERRSNYFQNNDGFFA